MPNLNKNGQKQLKLAKIGKTEKEKAKKSL